MPAETNYSSGPSGATGDGANVIGNPGGSIQDAMDASRNRLSSAYAAMQERSNQMLEGAEGYIQNRPFQAVIYAASVGAVIGFVAGMLLGAERTSDRSSWYRRWW
ncbi:MAG: hypothetical protein JWN13_4612 [Betaproteobacteria bacterium]|jgi:hypothetical protein|nr:hypothetical protein [Betaproteobacteria bacterium]MEA3154655.1 hypothetical protein [Betaproteobacteria bacterium]